MKKHIKSLTHHPIRVVIVSLVFAGILGFWGYKEINRVIPAPIVKDVSSVSNSSTSISRDLTLGFLASGRIKSVSVKAGDKVTKGQILATLDAGNTEGQLTQAEANYESAKAAYEKIINGATGSAIDVARAAVNTAKVNLDGTTKEQNLLVENAYANLLNSSLIAKSDVNNSLPAPIISGTYAKDKEGTITLTINQGGTTNGYFSIGGIFAGTGIVSTTTPEPILDTGLYIEFPADNSYLSTTWNIVIPNTTASNYLTNYNAYQNAIATKTTTTSNAQAILDQANSSLTALVTTARPEDVASAQAAMNSAEGAVQIAQAAYENTIITAPDNGTVVSVSITPGQIATTSAPAIDFISDSSN